MSSNYPNQLKKSSFALMSHDLPPQCHCSPQVCQDKCKTCLHSPSTLSQILRIPAAPVSLCLRPETKSPTQTKDSQFWFSQFVKCNFFDLAAATPDAMVDALLRSIMLSHVSRILDQRKAAKKNFGRQLLRGGTSCTVWEI